jgi:hypothetical protein
MLAAIAGSVVAGCLVVSVANATTWTGWGANGYKEGIRGYLQQNFASGSSTSGNRSTWLGLARFSPNNWSQVGLFQGRFAGGDSLGAVHMNYENKRSCGEYIGLDIGVPPSQPYFFSVKNTGNIVSIPCIDINGNYFGSVQAYEVLYKKGSAGNDPFYTGYMNGATGRADANTEWQGNFPTSLSYFGCRVASDCDDPAYGIEVKSAGGWSLCCASERAIYTGPPLWIFTYNDFWSFKTCPSLLQCSSP